MIKESQRISTVAQNTIIGTVTGIMVGINLRFIFLQLGGVEWVWLAFFALGPTLGYFSGRERQRVEKLKLANQELESNLDQIKQTLKQSTKKYQLLVEQANDAIFLTSGKGRFLLFNEATCRLSGYGKNELKMKSVGDLKPENDLQDDAANAWLDNGVYRYEETWIKADGNSIALEINARWIQFSDHRLVLHVARDIQRQKEVGIEERAAEYQQALEYHIKKSAAFHGRLYKDLLDPMYETIGLLKQLQSKYPQEAGSVARLLKIWDSSQKTITELSLKNDRDMGHNPAEWQLNDILHQELVYLDTLFDSSAFRIKTSFSRDLPPIYGFGRDFSLAFQAMFRALCEAQPDASAKGLLVSTKQIKDQLIVEMAAPGRDILREVIHDAVDPFHNGNVGMPMTKSDFGYYVIETLFKAFDGQIDMAYQEGKGNIVRIRIPVMAGSTKNRKNAALDAEETLII